jgi:hypothetical protein
VSEKPVLKICGLGAHPPGETSLEVLGALRGCDKVYLDVDDRALEDWLRPWCRRLRPASSLGETLERRVKALLDGIDGTVGVAVWGHPLLTSPLGIELVRKARPLGIRVEIPGAISPIGSAFAKAAAFFGGDYGHHGIQACSIDVLLGGSLPLDPDLPLIVFGESPEQGAWSRLGGRLSTLYPGVGTVRVFPHGAPESKVEPARVAEAVGTAARAVVMVEPKPASRPGRRRHAG